MLMVILYNNQSKTPYSLDLGKRDIPHEIITTLLQRLCSWIAFNISLSSAFHYSFFDFLALMSSNRLDVYFCIFNII